MALVLLLAPASLAAATDTPARIPLHWLWHEGQNDSAYTISPERRARLVRERGYVDMGVLALVDARPVLHARPLVCLYAPAPHTDTFCSISAVELRLNRAMKYLEIGVEGFVQRERVPGSVALYRLFRAQGDGPDREHRFVVSEDELVRLRRQGWGYEGVKGYVYPRP